MHQFRTGDSGLAGGALRRAARTRVGCVTVAATAVLAVNLYAPDVLVPAVRAQDVPGIELCSRESTMDRRTGCLQSNVEFLQKVITKNALDSQGRLAAAGREMAALRDQFAAASRESAALKDKLAAMEARLAQLEKAMREAKPEPKPEPKSEPKPEPKPGK